MFPSLDMLHPPILSLASSYPQSRPYSFGIGESRDRSEGLDLFYENERSTIRYRVSETPRKYASAFHPVTTRPPSSKHQQLPSLGPGSYTMHDDCSCGGITRMRENFRPSAVFAGRVGGKFAHLQEEDWW